MSQPPVLRLPSVIEPAARRVKAMAAAACERTVESLGLAALSSTNIFQRDGILAAQFELNRKSALFTQAFDRALDERLARELRLPGATAASGPTNWDAVGLVDDREVEVQVSAERLGAEIGQGCEWELRELNGFIGAIVESLGQRRQDMMANPLRPQTIGYAAVRGIEAVSDRRDVRKVLEAELVRSMAATMANTYAVIISDLRSVGLKAAGMSVRHADAPAASEFRRSESSSAPGAWNNLPRDASGAPAGYGFGAAAADRGRAANSSGPGSLGPSGHGGGWAPGAAGAPYAGSQAGALAGDAARHASTYGHGTRASSHGGSSQRASTLAAFSGQRGVGSAAYGAAPSRDSALRAYRDSMPGAWSGHGGQAGSAMGEVDAQLMSLMRRLAAEDAVTQAPASAAGNAASGFDDAGFGGYAEVTAEGLRLAAPNVIRAHRDELRQASGGSMDHMVIDVVGTLFDQILSDPKVPPQMARQIGRLQLPVLRTALGDPSFFSSRRHPVRRFINRMASLATAMDDLDSPRGREFLALVRELVQGIVEGDFDQAEVYEQKLSALEQFAAEQAQQETAEHGDAAALLAEREGDIRVQQHYAQQLHGELHTLSVPDFVRDFIAAVWSQVLVKVTRAEGADASRTQRMRQAGRDLFMSVQPKATGAQRKEFIAQLPRLMQSLNEGMDMIGWPDSAKKTFFGLLLPAHAQSLKGSETMRTLDFNLLAKQVDQVFERPLPAKEALPAITDPGALDESAILPTFSAEEAQRLGLVREAAVDWKAKVEPDASAEPAVTEVDIAIDGMPLPEAPEPTQGRSLADNVQIGFAYQMHIDGEWQKVRLTHVSPGRTFFVFSRGARHKQTISLTRRMVLKMCESDRLRAFESAYLIERATARARRQLAALKMPMAAAA